ncbi:hypothetical protein WDW89_04110 [Deltaproteobacteria bacterium TL4]
MSTKSKMSLSDLTNKTVEELDQLYLSAETPSISELDGQMKGRVLAGESVLENQHLRNLLMNPLYLPWKGKVFTPISPTKGEGENRVEVGLFKSRLFHFETREVPPLVGKNNVVALNYDLPENPWFIRHIRDDLKKLSEGLYLGTANVKIKDNYQFVLYFALEAA